MVVIGLDLSMKKTGVAIFKDGKLIETKLLVADLDRKKGACLKKFFRDGKALSYYYHEFNKLITEFEPSVVAMEKSFVGGMSAVEALYRLHGVANMAFRDIQQVYYMPTTVKKALCGTGKAKKEDMINKVIELYNVNVSEDEADAIGVVHCLLNDLEVK